MLTILKYKEEMRGYNKIYKYMFFFTIAIMFIACDKIDKQERYDENGNLKYLLYMQKDDTIKFFESFDDGRFLYRNNEKDTSSQDTLREYYKNGNKMFELVEMGNIGHITNFFINGKKRSEGFLFNKKNIGWWNYYDNNKLIKRIYFAQVDNNLLMPQLQIFDSNGQLNKNKSDFIDILIPDTLYKGRSTGTISYKKKIENSEERIGIGYNVEPDYNNLKNVRVDTFYNPKSDGFFGVEFNNLGKQKIRGFIYERKLNVLNETNANIRITNIYFEKDFYIIPRPDSIPKDKVIRYDNLQR